MKMKKKTKILFKIFKYLSIIWISIIVGAQLGMYEQHTRLKQKAIDYPSKICYEWRDLEIIIFNKLQE